MRAPEWLHGALGPGRALRPVADGIWSALSEGAPSAPYDGRAKLYDRLIGGRLYNRIAWGTSPAAYTVFAARAAASGEGALLDAGCGTLVSTAAAHAASGRPTVLVDVSADMLRAGRDRLVAHAGRLPAHLALVQADVLDLPFRDAAFGSVLCPGLLHLFEDVEGLARALARVAAPTARLHLSTLVTDRPLGRRYLAALHRAGEVASPRDLATLAARLTASAALSDVTLTREGNMAFVTAAPNAIGGLMPDRGRG